MYDELIKALRGCVLSKPCDACPYYDPNGPTKECATMNIAAADAIEELSKYVNYIGRLKCEGWYLQQTKYHDGYQAMATMPLPEPPKEE